ncbi:MAG: hypothetical protein FWH57_06820 [Oscillospiraceae bacterium]|nr:hypothetical protein [Oscillospiraceae bacterium]
MSIISEVKCARCDRKYSGVRSRCPYCGARRIGRGKYSEDSDNSKGKMLIGVLIMSVLVIAVAVLLFTTDKPEAVDADPQQINKTDGINPDDDDNTEMPGTNPVIPTPSATPELENSPEPTVSPTPEVRSVTITYAGKEKKDFTVKVGESVSLRVKIDPVGVEEEIIWTSSDRNVFEVVELNTEKTSAKVTGIGAGVATLTVTVGDVVAECTVRGRKG